LTGHPLLYAMLSVMVLFWSANFTVSKVALREFSPVLLTGMRLTLAAAMMAPVYLWQRSRAPEDRWTREDAPLLLMLGVFGVGLNHLLFMIGLSRTSVAHSSIIVALGPIMILIIASLMGLERISRRKAMGMAIALGGVAMLKILEIKPATGQGPTWTGDILTFCGTMCFALFTVFGKRVSKVHSAVTVNTFGYVAGALVLAPITLWNCAGFSFGQISPAGWAALAYMALFPSVVCYLIYYYALSHIAASRVAAFSYLVPLLATTMGAFLLREHITASLVASGAVVFTGVYLTERG
jgi:drug/metabolite transporter (DMT)-like permease